MNLSPWEIKKARATNLPEYLLGQDFQLKEEGSGNFRVCGLQGLIVKENYWFRHSTSEYGNAIDFVMKFQNLTFYNAVTKLIGQGVEVLPKKGLYWEFRNDSKMAEEYLLHERKIDAEIVASLIKLGKVKQDKANCICFLEFNEDKEIVYIFRRNIAGNSFRGEVKGSNKLQSFQLIIEKDRIVEKSVEGVIETLYIVEGAIDACALATLLKIKGKLAQPLQIITTAGAPHSLLKNRIEKINPRKIVIATDMDTQGRHYAHSIETMMLKTDYSISTPIYNAKDPAELLQKLSKNLGR